MSRWIWWVALLATVAPAAAQQPFGSTCDLPEVGLVGGRERCLLAAQAVASAQPQLGILIAAGNPVIGTATSGGLRLGVIPRVSGGIKANVVLVEVPDLLGSETGGSPGAASEAFRVPAPALSGDVAIGLAPGVSVAPTLGGIGSVALLGNATWLPFNAFDVEGFSREAPDFAYGVGARIGLLRESFTVPGVSLSLMYRSLGNVAFGNVCDASVSDFSFADPRTGETFSFAACPTGGDAGEFSFDLTDWSGRFAVSKRFLGLGLTGGIGYDRFESDLGFGFRSRSGFTGPGNVALTPVFRVRDVGLEEDRWSAFADLSYTFLVGTLAVEGGWMQGGEPIPGFQEVPTEFDPGSGSWFGSVGVRLAF